MVLNDKNRCVDELHRKAFGGEMDVRKQQVEGPESDDEPGLPNLKDIANECHRRMAEKPLFALHFIGQDGAVRTFEYADLDSNSSFTSEYICLCFQGNDAAEGADLRSQSVAGVRQHSSSPNAVDLAGGGRTNFEQPGSIATEVRFEKLAEERDED
jgi:hypothetical protein